MQAVTLVLRWPMGALAKGLSVDLEVVKRD
jgi:hypothetical protein